jgi:hypothetical protein
MSLFENILERGMKYLLSSIEDSASLELACCLHFGPGKMCFLLKEHISSFRGFVIGVLMDMFRDALLFVCFKTESCSVFMDSFRERIVLRESLHRERDFLLKFSVGNFDLTLILSGQFSF